MAIPKKNTTPAPLSGDQARVLANELRSYAHSLIGTHVVAEYNEQIRKWQMHLNRVVDAQQDAHNNHKGVFTKMAAEDGLAMLALSFVAGPMFSWLSHSLQASLKAKYENMFLNKPEILLKNESMEKGLTSKAFGDLVNSTVKLGTDRVFRLQAGTGSSTQPISTDGKIESFKTVVENALLQEASLRSTAIFNLAMDVLNDARYGYDLLDELYRKAPGSNYARYENQEEAAKAMIRVRINEMRAGWAKDWLYFGNDPKPEELYSMSKKIEIEIWGLWILQRKYHLSKSKGQWHIGEPIPVDEDGNMLREAVVNRLIDLDVVLTTRPTKKLFESEPWYEAKEAAKRQKERLEKDPWMSIPVKVVGKVDTEEEVKALNDWAANHKVERLGGKVQSVPRFLPPIDQIHRKP